MVCIYVCVYSVAAVCVKCCLVDDTCAIACVRVDMCSAVVCLRECEVDDACVTMVCMCLERSCVCVCVCVCPRAQCSE